MRLLAAVCLALAAGAGAWGAGADCLSCHSDKASPPTSVKDSVHGALGCTGCHSDIKAFPHPDHVAKVNCGSCHSGSAAALDHSVHAASNGGNAPGCMNCHGDAHSILPAKNPKSATYAANLPRTCGACHGDAKLAKKHGITEVYSMYMDSIHGFALTKDGLLVAASCSSCHGSHKILSKKDPASRTNRAHIAETCGSCHAGPRQDYMAGIHGQGAETGDARAPVCTDCHTTHQIADVKTTAWQMKTSATCGNCHKEKFETYHDTFHAQVSALGYVETAHCWDCHGFHDIRPGTDPKSMIAKANLQSTCGKCHGSSVNASFVSYQPHANRRNFAEYPALWTWALFMNVLVIGVLGFFALHTLLWLNRSLAERRNRLAPLGGGGHE